MQSNYLQSLGSYQQHQQNTPYLQNHPGASNSISNFNPINQYTGNPFDGFPPSNSNNNQFASTKMAANQNSELSEIKNMMTFCYKEKFLVIKTRLVIHPLPHVIFNKKGYLAKNCFTTKTCF